MEPSTNPFSNSGGLGLPETQMGTEQSLRQEWPTIQQPGPDQPTQNGINNGNVNNMILGAVKEAFMEVDEEAPGGWHGWRMFSEMVQPESNTTGEGIEYSSSRMGTTHDMAGLPMSGHQLQAGENELPVLWDDVPNGFYFGSGTPQANLDAMSTDHGLWTMDGFQGMR